MLWIATCAAALAVLSVSAPMSVTEYGVPLIVALLFSVVLAVAMPVALVMPIVGVALALLGATVLTATAKFTTTAPWPASVSSIIALTIVCFIAGWRARWWLPAATWLAGVMLISIAAAEAKSAVPTAAVIADLVVFAALTLLAAIMGIVVRNWTDVRRQLTEQRALSAAETAEREAAEEKARIARELHDVVAHGMSAIQVRAASAKYRLANLSPEAVAEFDEVAATARASMGDMRSILGVLRDEATSAETAPQPGFSDLGSLIERAHQLAPITMHGSWQLSAHERDDAVFGLAVYRAVQEALSNAAKHAPGAPVTITWSEAPTNRTVAVANGRSTHPADPHRPGGQGLRGMQERLHVLGGSVSAAPTGAGFDIVITIPRKETAT